MTRTTILVVVHGEVAAAMSGLGLAQRLREDGGRIGVVLLGGSPAAAASLAPYGVDQVWVTTGGDRPGQAESIARLAEAEGAGLVLGVDSEALTGVLAEAAAALRAPFAPGCIRFARGGGGFAIGRPCLQGGAFAQLQFEGDGPLVASVVADAFWPAQPGRPGEAALHEVTVGEAGGVRVLEEVPPDPANMDLGDAELVIGAGAGIGSKEGYELLSRLATTLGGVVGASRVVVDRGWSPREKQIGQTGRTIAPRVYVAWGVSGAIQHVAGIRRSQTIIAVNHDPGAPLFRFADVQVLADAPSLAAAMLQQAGSCTAEGRKEAAG